MIYFIPLGGGEEIGANCYYLNIEGTGIILDCGRHPKKSGADALPAFDILENHPVDYVLISHAHQDHIGSLPFLVQKHPYIKIVSTPQTRALAEITLHDSVSIIKEQIDSSIYPQDIKKTAPGEFKIYSHEEIDLLIRAIDYKSYGEEFFISGYSHLSKEPIKITFYDAGHILGSAGILIEHKSKRIFYTGDINMDNQELLSGAKLPSGKIDLLIVETTYGATDSSEILSWSEESLRLAKSANKILNAGGSILIPVFALGKTQEMLTVVWNLMQKRKLAATDIFTGGIGNKISRVYDYNRYVVNMRNPDFELTSIPVKKINKVKRDDYFFKHSSIVLASSGMMLAKTMSYKLAAKWLRQKDSAIFTVGYMDEDTPGFKIANAEKGDKISFNNKTHNVECEIKKFRFPAHSKREGILKVVEKLNPATVILVHGEPDAIDRVGASVLKNFKGKKVFRAVNRKPVSL